MKFLLDAQLPVGIVFALRARGIDAVHTAELPSGNHTPDSEILNVCAKEERILMTKDEDFVDSFVIKRQPSKLLVISTGNIPNSELREILCRNIEQIVSLLRTSSYLELGRQGLLVHE